MRILIYGLNYAPEVTGIGKYTGEMAAWLSSRGHEVRIVCAPPYYPQWRIAEGYNWARYKVEVVDGIRVYRCPVWIPPRPSGVRRILHLGSFAISSSIVMLAQVGWRPDIILIIEPPIFCAPIAILTARLSGARAWLHIQDFELDAAFELGLIRVGWLRSIACYIERWLMRRFDLVSTISNRMFERLGVKGVPFSRRVLFANWVDANQIYPMIQPSSFRDELGIGLQGVVALYSGNMGQKQGLEIVIEAARSLSSESNVCFVMCGQGAAYSRLRAMAEGLANIIWIPLQPMERLNELLNLADIHLLPQSANAADLVIWRTNPGPARFPLMARVDQYPTAGK